MLLVVLDRRVVPCPQLEGRGPLPLIVESPNSAEAGGEPLTVQPAEDAAGVDCVQLAWVSYQENFRAGFLCLLHKCSKLKGGHHGRFVNDDELIRVEAPALLGCG